MPVPAAAFDHPLRDYSTAYRELTRRDRPHYLRAALELAAILGGGTVWYWVDRERQVADWDYPSWEQRLTFEAWRFDNNPFGINFIWHAMSGTSFHAVARSNQLGMLGALGYGFATSMAWEYLLEFREKISINDVLVTPGAGVTMGEFFFWLGRYLDSPNDRLGTLGRAARWSVGLPVTLHDRLDRRSWPDGPEPDALGFRTDIYHRFHLALGGALSATEREVAGVTSDRSLPLSRVELSGRLVALPGYLEPTDFAGWFRDGNVTSLDLSVAVGDGASGVDVDADTILFGRAVQRVAEGEGGYALIVGSSIGYQYRRQSLAEFRDRLGLLHLPGLAVDGALLGRHFRLTGFARVHGDFAGVSALSFETWREAHPDLVPKTALDRYGYYYGWGFSSRLGAELSTSRLALGGALAAGRYFSQEGLDRNQESLTADVTASDRVVDTSAWLRVMPLGSRLTLELSFTRHSRRGHVGGVWGEQKLVSAALWLGALL